MQTQTLGLVVLGNMFFFFCNTCLRQYVFRVILAVDISKTDFNPNSQLLKPGLDYFSNDADGLEKS